MPKDPEKIAHWLMDDLNPPLGSVCVTDNWEELCKSGPNECFKGIQLSYQKYNTINVSRIETCLYVWSSTGKSQYEQDVVGFFLSDIEDEEFGELVEMISRWFSHISDNGEEYENLLFMSIKKLLSFYKKVPEAIPCAQNYSDIIYSPVGRHVNALMKMLLLAQEDIKEKGLPERYKTFFTLLCENTDIVSLHGCVILASYANALFSFDKKWTEENLLQKLTNGTWEESKLIWSGFFHCSKINITPIVDLIK